MFLKKLKIAHKIVAVIIAGILIAIAFAAGAVMIAEKETGRLESIYIENVRPLDNLRKIQLIFRELEYRMAGVQADLVAAIASGTHLEKSLSYIDVAWNDVKLVISDDQISEDITKAMQTFETANKDFKNNVASELRKVYLDNDPDSVADLYDRYLDYKPLIFTSIDKMADTLREDVKQHYEENQKNIITIKTLVAVITVIVIGFFTAFALFIVRSINRPIKTVVAGAKQVARGDLTHTINVDTKDEMGDMASRLNIMIATLGDAFSKIVASVKTMSSNIEGISDLSENLLGGAEQQRETGEQVAAASTEMSQTLVDMAKDTADASDTTKESFNTATAGKEVVKQTVESITNLAENVSEATKTINGLGSSLREIGEIVSVIQDIASQTNLLALNAAIEAARSGEYGRGFAVVADEVKKLAERTSHATHEIAAKIDAIQTKSEESITTMEKGSLLAEESVSNAEKAGEALQQIVESSDKVTGMVQRVAAATKDQSAASEEVTQKMEYIAKTINDNLNLSKGMQKAATDLAFLARDVMTQTMHFKTERKGNASVEELQDISPDIETADESGNLNLGLAQK